MVPVPMPVVQPHILVIMGLPLYGRTWQLKSPSDNRIGPPAIVIGLGHNGVSVYDKRTVSMYSYTGTNWIGYERLSLRGNKAFVCISYGPFDMTRTGPSQRNRYVSLDWSSSSNCFKRQQYKIV